MNLTIARAVTTREGQRLGMDQDTLVTHTLRAEGFDASEDGTGRGVPIIPIDMRQASRGGKFTNNRKEGSSGGAPGAGIGEVGDPCPTLATDSHQPAVAMPFTFQTRIARNGRGQPDEVAGALTSCEGGTHADCKPHVADQFGVRRLMPIECLRLQGFPDIWLDGLGLSDSAKYRMIGNAVAIPVVEWIAKRIAAAN